MIDSRSAWKFIADGSESYSTPWIGHGQGFRVKVNGKNVYGTNAVIISGAGFVPQYSDKNGQYSIVGRGRFLEYPMQLRFLRNVPPAGTPVEVFRSVETWSEDFTHPNANGNRIIGNVCVESLRNIITSGAIND